MTTTRREMIQAGLFGIAVAMGISGCGEEEPIPEPVQPSRGNLPLDDMINFFPRDKRVHNVLVYCANGDDNQLKGYVKHTFNQSNAKRAGTTDGRSHKITIGPGIDRVVRMQDWTKAPDGRGNLVHNDVNITLVAEGEDVPTVEGGYDLIQFRGTTDQMDRMHSQVADKKAEHSVLHFACTDGYKFIPTHADAKTAVIGGRGLQYEEMNTWLLLQTFRAVMKNDNWQQAYNLLRNRSRAYVGQGRVVLPGDPRYKYELETLMAGEMRQLTQTAERERRARQQRRRPAPRPVSRPAPQPEVRPEPVRRTSPELVPVTRTVPRPEPVRQDQLPLGSLPLDNFSEFNDIDRVLIYFDDNNEKYGFYETLRARGYRQGKSRNRSKIGGGRERFTVNTSKGTATYDLVVRGQAIPGNRYDYIQLRGHHGAMPRLHEEAIKHKADHTILYLGGCSSVKYIQGYASEEVAVIAGPGRQDTSQNTLMAMQVPIHAAKTRNWKSFRRSMGKQSPLRVGQGSLTKAGSILLPGDEHYTIQRLDPRY